jgi:hypothetical protein
MRIEPSSKKQEKQGDGSAVHLKNSNKETIFSKIEESIKHAGRDLNISMQMHISNI